MTTKFRIVRSLALFVACTQGSCTDEGQRASLELADAAPKQVMLEEVELLDHTGWIEYPRSEDPLPSHEPERVDCGPAGWYVEPLLEAPVLEIDTRYCNYALLEHLAAVDVAVSDEITLELRHFDLRAPEPTQAHIAIVFDDAVEWETFIPIPSDASAQVYQWRARRALAAGAPIRLHLHNHGQNTWIVASLHARVHPTPATKGAGP